jgi:EAL domain-containing protein (putative c-di-GMP-specific phosphodiesterase class I)
MHKAFRCDDAQGYCFSKPVGAGAARESALQKCVLEEAQDACNDLTASA